MKSYASIVSRIVKEAQYAYHGYSDRYSAGDGSMDGFDSPVTSPMSPMDRGLHTKLYPWKAVEEEMEDDWGVHEPMRPDGTQAKYEKKRCKECRGKGCHDCYNRGYIYKVRRRNNIPEDENGWVANQPHHNRVTWPHNRDIPRDPKEEVVTWNEWVKKPMLGRPLI